ncbi:MAG: dTDP-glucose 4,6-dehydratase [Infirmifilum sp.]
MRVLVTGGAGFIGSSFVRVALERGWDVLVYDKLTYAGRPENLKEVSEKIELVKGDIGDEALLGDVLKRFEPEVLVNFAAETHVDRSINDPAPFIRTNVLGVYAMLEVLRRHREVLLVHVSTDEVYGDIAEGFASEESPLRPSSPYSASKGGGDLLVMSYGRTYGLRYRIVRPCNNYGPRQHPEKLVPKTIIRLLHGKPAVVYGDGGQVRDWLYVEDCAKAILAVVEAGMDGEVYNVCRGEFATVVEVVRRIAEVMGVDPASSYVRVGDRPGGDRRYAMVCEKIRRLGWRPEVGLAEGLKRTVEWYLKNDWWWRPLVDERYVLSDEPW